VTTTSVQCDNVKPFSSGGLTLPATHFASVSHNRIAHIKLYTQSKRRIPTTASSSHCTISSFVFGRSAA